MLPRVRTVVLLALLCVVGAPAAAQQADAAARFNGTWEWRLGSMERGGQEVSAEFRIWALDERRLQVEFLGLFAHKDQYGRTANSGQASGVAVVQRGEATFRSESVERDCRFKLILRLSGDQMVVSQYGDTCFGFNVSAVGTYRRVDAGQPVFELSTPRPGERGVKPAP